MTDPEKTPTPAAVDDTPVSTTASRLFDLRSVIALLYGVYGIVLLILGLVSTSAEDLAKTGGWDINRDSGIAMLVIAALFLLWVRLRPVRTSARGVGDTGETEGTTGDAAGSPSP